MDTGSFYASMDLTAVSGIAGSISIACWIVVFSPQIIENFRRSSAEGLSVVFVVIWLVGDVFNILGAVLQGVLPTMTILAVYYTLADIVLLLQVFYYRGFTLSDTTKLSEASSALPNEQSALLSQQHTNGQGSPNRITFPSDSPGSSRRSSATIREHFASLDAAHLSPATPLHNSRRESVNLSRNPPSHKNKSILQAVFFNLTAILVVCAAGILGWYLSNTRTAKSSHYDHGEHDHHHHTQHNDRHSPLQFDVLGQVFGYICAVLYLGSRVPQLLLNYRRKSTEGVSMLFFLFACIGNATYVLSILAYEPDCLRGKVKHGSCGRGEAGEMYGKYMLVNLSWLIGSFGTLVLDFMVFIQYFWYRDQIANEVAVEN